MYNFKAVQEAGWAVLFAVGTFLAQTATDFPERSDDWGTYAWAITVGVIRVVGGVVLSTFKVEPVSTRRAAPGARRARRAR